MKKILRGASGVALGVIGLAACDAPPSAGPDLARPVESLATEEAGAPVARYGLSELIHTEDTYTRAVRLGSLLPMLGPEALLEVKEVLRDQRLDPRALEIELLLRYWATHEPEEATRWAVEQSPPGYRTAAVLTALELWAAQDPRAAADASQEFSQRADVRDIVIVALVRGWFRNDREELAEFIRDIGLGVARQRAMTIFLRALIQEEGPEAAMRWAESVPEEEESYKLAVYRQLTWALNIFDPAAVLRWCEAHCDGPFGKHLRSAVANGMVSRGEGEAALTWLSTAPESHESRLAVWTNFDRWKKTDREAAMDWLKAQANGEPGEVPLWLQPALPVYARALAEEAPAEAIVWAKHIEADDQREGALVDIARLWRRVDEAAAVAWLEESPLSEEARARVMVPLPQQPRIPDVGFPLDAQDD